MKYRKYLILFILIMILLMSDSKTLAVGQSSTNYAIDVDVIDGGGGDGSSTSYYLSHSIGQSTAIGESSNSNYYNYAGFWYALRGVGCRISGIGMNTPAAEKWRASMAVDIEGSILSPSGSIKYYYTRQRVSLESTSIASVSVVGSIATITGVGNAKKYIGDSWSYCTGCSFIATIEDGGPDKMDMEIDGGVFYSAPGGLKDLDRGDFNITCQ
jgi:hypothetical protein